MTIDLQRETKPKLIRPLTQSLIWHLVKKLHSEGKYRPKTNLVIMHQGSILQSKFVKKNTPETSFFGGGIDLDDENIESAVLRELHEETRITPEDIDFIEFLGQDYKEFKECQKGRDGFSIGQYYFYFRINLKTNFNREKIVYENNYEGSWANSRKKVINSMRAERQHAVAKILPTAPFTPQMPQPVSHESHQL